MKNKKTIESISDYLARLMCLNVADLFATDVTVT